MPCDEQGNYLPAGTPPPRHPDIGPDNWAPYESRLQFEATDFFYTRNQTSNGDIDFLLNLWAASLAEHGAKPPFTSHEDVYKTIDSTVLGDVPWESFSLGYDGDLPENNVPKWMTAEHDIWFRNPQSVIRNMLSNPDFKDEFDCTPFQEYDSEDNHRFKDFMSGNWGWKQGVRSTISFDNI